MSNSVEWGSVADWVSGIGSMAAVFAALTIAFMEWRRAKRSERRSRLVALGKHFAVTSEALRLADDMIFQCEFFLENYENAPQAGKANLITLFRKNMDSLRSQLGILLSFPSDDPRLFVEIGRLKSMCDTDDRSMRVTSDYVFGTVSDLLMLTKERREKIKDMPSLA